MPEDCRFQSPLHLTCCRLSVRKQEQAMVRRQRAGSQKAWATTQVLPLRSWEALDKLPRHLWLQLAHWSMH